MGQIHSEHATLVCGNHILDVNVGILASMLLQDFQSLLNQFRQVFVLSLSIVYFIADVQSLIFEHVEHGQNLPVVRYQGLSDHLTCQNQFLNLF
jgi:hypothetical protein